MFAQSHEPASRRALAWCVSPPPGLEPKGIMEHINPTSFTWEGSEGSNGHPELCGRPCVYFRKGDKCLNGTACGYCHLPHTAWIRPNKRFRQVRALANDQ
ncbi:unnamed protein product, partial [Symbiodinium pilosum]